MEPLRVVVVDDSADVRFLISANLELDGDVSVVGEASSSSEALALIAESAPDVAVVDIRMGIVPGSSIIGDLKRAAPEMKIVMCSAFADDKLQKKVLDRGADAFVPKSDVSTHLLEIIRGLAGR